MNSSKRIAIDAMGGEGGASITVPASLQALENNPDLLLTLVGDENRIRPLAAKINASLRTRLTISHTESSIGDVEKPAQVLRSSKQSSMYIAVEMLKNGQVDAMVSAGNTGALLMIGRHLLKTITGIQKPALVASIPGATRQSLLLDVGANPVCNAQQLFEFAVMGSVLAQSLNGAKPSVGLLNIGAENYKGTTEVRTASEMLEACGDVNYVGFIEANKLFEGAADVIVCDGFVGNVTIKSSAGVANVVNRIVTQQLAESWLARLSSVFSSSVLSRLKKQINPHQFNGASLLGLQGSIVKSHGNANAEGFGQAISQAIKEIDNAVPDLIASKVASIMATSEQQA